MLPEGTPGIDREALIESVELAIHNVVREQEQRELKRVGEVQASAHAHFTRLLNVSPAVIYCRMASGDYNPTFVSDGVTRLFGCTPQDYLANPYLWRDRVHPDDVKPINDWVDRMFDDDRGSIEYRIKRDDGTYFWVHDRQHVVRDESGKAIEIVGSWTDITERKEAEEARVGAQARLHVLLDAAPSVIYSFAASGDFAPTFVSANIKTLLGYEPEEYLEHADFWRESVHPEDLPEVEANQVQLFRSGRHFSEYRFRKKDRTYCWVSDEQHLVRDAKGHPLEVVGSWSNIDKRKEAEMALLSAQAEL